MNSNVLQNNNIIKELQWPQNIFTILKSLTTILYSLSSSLYSFSRLLYSLRIFSFHISLFIETGATPPIIPKESSAVEKVGEIDYHLLNQDYNESG